MSELTPMMRQYLAVKEKYKDAILFYRLGDFYEMFFEDAEKASKLLNLTLTSRNKNEADAVPLCGVPHHSAQTYINRLVAMGHKVAICEQMEDPRLAKGVVKREVVQVVTPGMNLDPNSLEGKANNYLAALFDEKGRFGLAVVDVSTGGFRLTECDNDRLLEVELCRIEPSEIVLAHGQKKMFWTEMLSRLFPTIRISPVTLYSTDHDYISDLFRRYYRIPVEVLGLDQHLQALQAGSLILSYLAETKLLQPELLKRPFFYRTSDFLVLDGPAQKNLELTKTLADGSEEGSLFWILNQAACPMGSRKIREWLTHPLVDVSRIEARLDAVSELKANPSYLEGIRKELGRIGDLERIENRIVAGFANARDITALSQSLIPVGEIKQILQGAQSSLLAEVAWGVDPLPELVTEINRILVDDPPPSLQEGGLIREGVLAELDELRTLERDGKSFIAGLEAREREATGIGSLKIRYNQVFGYSIEITHPHRDKVPPHYIRKQTLTQAERYITGELKEYEEKILGASQKICQIEYNEFIRLRQWTAGFAERVKRTANSIAELDALASLAFVALERRYSRPEIVEEPVLEIKKGRHPTVEVLSRGESFVPNDLLLNTADQRLLMITGPNMAGKSTVMRQAALICIMAQMGSFVPAESARIGIVDRIFTRIGATDHLQKGQSTFMVEMLETSLVLSQATEKSLILLDEIGRGTSTFDGLAIAWAVSETIHDRIKARTLFATHYHELTDLALEREGIKNYQMSVKEYGGEIVFLRELVKGATNRSYGVHVAAMAGLPAETIKRAREILRILEEKDLQFQAATQKEADQPSLFSPARDTVPNHPVWEEIKKLDLDRLSPLQALNFLAELQKKV